MCSCPCVLHLCVVPVPLVTFTYCTLQACMAGGGSAGTALAAWCGVLFTHVTHCIPPLPALEATGRLAGTARICLLFAQHVWHDCRQAYALLCLRVCQQLACTHRWLCAQQSRLVVPVTLPVPVWGWRGVLQVWLRHLLLLPCCSITLCTLLVVAPCCFAASGAPHAHAWHRWAAAGHLLACVLACMSCSAALCHVLVSRFLLPFLAVCCPVWSGWGHL